MFLDKQNTVAPLSRLKSISAGILSAALLAGVVLGPAMASAQADQQPAVTEALTSTPVLDINSAEAEEIADVLQGVGLQKATAIVQYRSEHGPFATVNDLLKVRGIGAATLAKNQQLIKLD